MPALSCQKTMKDKLLIKSAVCYCSDNNKLQDFGLQGIEIDKQLMPANIRRRASLTTKMAISVATEACLQAEVNPSELRSVFASVGGEIQVTDVLCGTLTDSQAMLSPTHFHNSVHNTTAGYWGILYGCHYATTAIAAVDDTFAMALLEVWMQLQQQPGDCLLVCYDEFWPQYLAPPIGKLAFATALVLSNDGQSSAKGAVFRPQIASEYSDLSEDLNDLIELSPIASAIPLLQAVQQSPALALVPLNRDQPQWSTWFKEIT